MVDRVQVLEDVMVLKVLDVVVETVALLEVLVVVVLFDVELVNEVVVDVERVVVRVEETWKSVKLMLTPPKSLQLPLYGATMMPTALGGTSTDSNLKL